MSLFHFRKFAILISIFLLTVSACGKATSEQNGFVNLEGNYNIAGKNPDGSNYGCILSVVPNGEVYKWYWSSCGDYEGIGIQQGNVVSVAWGSPDCTVVSYDIQEDGTLKAKWTPINYTNLGSEMAISTLKNGPLEGSYKVSGTNPDGSRYDGALEVTAEGNVYRWAWNTGNEILGVGIQRDNIVSVAYGSAGCSIVSYLIHTDKSLEALWAYVGTSETGSESVTPFSSEVTINTEQVNNQEAGEIGQQLSDAPVRPSAGCGKESPNFPGATSTMPIVVNVLDRIYLLHLPTDYDQNKPTSLVLNFHGYTDSAGGMESGTGMSYHADKYGYIVVYPQATHFTSKSGLITSWNDLTCNASPGPAGPICSEDAASYAFPTDCGPDVSKECNWCTCNDDLGYVNLMLDELEADLCVDLNRVYATGMSNGGMFVHRLGCDVADRFAAIVPVSGTLARGFNCAPDTADPISIMNIHGRDDNYVDVTGKESTDGYFYTAIDDVMALWASSSSQNCDENVTPYPTIADGIRGMKCTQNDNCATGSEIVSCWWDAGHAWPGGVTQWGDDMIWDFFLRNAKNIKP